MGGISKNRKSVTNIDICDLLDKFITPNCCVIKQLDSEPDSIICFNYDFSKESCQKCIREWINK